ncbi:type 1 periplasmic-binding domain-containing protein [Herbiconiux ginsengi]|uniref:BMP family ABC transporter substrate-binding protein n=1 Tax=Herbiconiux ginsengi TaxID=381665 RepID=A0A1H3L392_9MICO|nr:hypothetical protein [Herbiconiux ginsengi]SDY58902.1 hypothetical protein SAMN05216554_0809 [Herbiconiux ginsengi]
MRPHPKTLASLTVSLLLAAFLSGCSAGDWSQPHAMPTAVGALGDGFLPADPPSPEATIDPTEGSWNDVHPSAGLRVVLLWAGDGDAEDAMTGAVRSWAHDEQVDLREVEAGANPIDSVVEAMQMQPDLIISAGNDLIDPLAAVTASHLDQQFLVIGAELAEPTENVTAVDWTGAAFRGEGLGASSHYDPATFTPERCAAAVRAGMAAVLHDETGIVIWID